MNLLERLWRRVRYGHGCWEWTGNRDRHGYGRIQRGGGLGTALVHRVVYETIVGPVPAGLVIDHLCRNPSCVNPDHMEVVTQGENIRRGNMYDLRRAKTHCPQGHEYNDENTRIKDGGRCCRVCDRDAARRSYENRKAR